MNVKNKKLKIAKNTLISYSKSNSGKNYFQTDPTSVTVVTLTLTGIYNVKG